MNHEKFVLHLEERRNRLIRYAEELETSLKELFESRSARDPKAFTFALHSATAWLDILMEENVISRGGFNPNEFNVLPVNLIKLLLPTKEQGLFPSHDVRVRKLLKLGVNYGLKVTTCVYEPEDLSSSHTELKRVSFGYGDWYPVSPANQSLLIKCPQVRKSCPDCETLSFRPHYRSFSC